MDTLTRPMPGSRRYRLKLALEHELDRDERLLWHGPALGRLQWSAFLIWVVAIPWTAFSLFWTAMAASAPMSVKDSNNWGLLAWAFPMFGLPFIAVGLAMMALPFVPLWERGKVLFAITDRRVLRLRLGRDLKVTECLRARIGLIERTERSDRTGTLKLAMRIGLDSDGDKVVEHFEIGTIADVRRAHSYLSSELAAA